MTAKAMSVRDVKQKAFEFLGGDKIEDPEETKLKAKLGRTHAFIADLSDLAKEFSHVDDAAKGLALAYKELAQVLQTLVLQDGSDEGICMMGTLEQFTTRQRVLCQAVQSHLLRVVSNAVESASVNSQRLDDFTVQYKKSQFALSHFTRIVAKQERAEKDAFEKQQRTKVKIDSTSQPLSSVAVVDPDKDMPAFQLKESQKLKVLFFL
jgi:hypothetical protein